ncbi:MAG: transketolase family protein [Candidatus Pacebacteria bacterium]|nr:transketolase family protein [Candidatus Paceibacterota bacterium]
MKKILKSTRDGFGEALLELGQENENIVVLSADLTESTRADKFAEKYPERFVQVGVAEQDMASVASGMSAMGKIPFMTSFSIFSPGRNWEQIRTTIAYNNANVKIIGSHAGVVTGEDGGSHQALEDIALMRAIPRVTIFSPAGFEEAKKLTKKAAQIEGPVYIRLSRMATEDIDFENLSQEGDLPAGEAGIVIMATGHLVAQAVIASQELEKEGISTRVVNISQIKPLEEERILTIAKKSKAIVTVEDHQQAGGMGSAIAELLSQKLPTKIKFIAVKDQFGQSGKAEELLKHYALDKEAIKKAIYDLSL